MSIIIHRDYISRENTYAGSNNPIYIVVHETDNTAKGAGAERHAQAQKNGNLQTSVHYYSGSDGVYQAAEHFDGTFSIGREYGGNHSVKDANNRNTINIEICVNEDGDYSTARANAIELVKYLIQTTGIPSERVIRHYDAKGKYCPRKMMDDPALWEDFKAQISGKVQQPGQSTGSTQKPEQEKPQQRPQNPSSAGNNLIRDGQIHANNFAQCGLDPDGIRGNLTKKASVKVLQRALNCDHAAALEEDGIFGKKTAAALGTHCVKKGKTQYLVTALEILLMLKGYDPHGVECPGVFGSGLEACVRRYQNDSALTADGIAGTKTFQSLIR